MEEPNVPNIRGVVMINHHEWQVLNAILDCGGSLRFAITSLLKSSDALAFVDAQRTKQGCSREEWVTLFAADTVQKLIAVKILRADERGNGIYYLTSR